MEGQYVRMLSATSRRRGIIARARYDEGKVLFLFRRDPRLDDSFPDLWLLETEFAPCERPTDLQVAAKFLAASKSGSAGK
jgi:hypothetical protein